MRATMFLSAILMLVSGCSVSTPSPYLPRPVPGSERLKVVMKEVPPQCEPGKSLNGLGRGRGNTNFVWEAALTDIRNKAFNGGFDGVVIMNYVAKRKGGMLEISVTGNGFRCTGKADVQRQDLPSHPGRRPRARRPMDRPPRDNPPRGVPPQDDGGFGVRPPTPAAPPAEPQPIEPNEVDQAPSGSPENDPYESMN